MKTLHKLRKFFFPNRAELIESSRRSLFPTPEEAAQDRKKMINELLIIGFFLAFMLSLIFL